MRFAAIHKWLFIITTGGCLLGSGCPDGTQLRNELADAASSLIGDLAILFISSAFSTTFGI